VGATWCAEGKSAKKAGWYLGKREVRGRGGLTCKWKKWGDMGSDKMTAGLGAEGGKENYGGWEARQTLRGGGGTVHVGWIRPKGSQGRVESGEWTWSNEQGKKKNGCLWGKNWRSRRRKAVM